MTATRSRRSRPPKRRRRWSGRVGCRLAQIPQLRWVLLEQERDAFLAGELDNATMGIAAPTSIDSRAQDWATLAGRRAWPRRDASWWGAPCSRPGPTAPGTGCRRPRPRRGLLCTSPRRLVGRDGSTTPVRPGAARTGAARPRVRRLDRLVGTAGLVPAVGRPGTSPSSSCLTRPWPICRVRRRARRRRSPRPRAPPGRPRWTWSGTPRAGGGGGSALGAGG